jgi:methanethiol S-methyltransferase
MPSSVLLFAGCFVIWAFVHSLLADPGVKGRVRRALGAKASRWYRLAYGAFAVLSIVPMLILLVVLPDRVLYSIPSPWRWPMVAVQALAVVGLTATVLQTGAFRFLGITQALAPGEDENGPLQVRGFYCRVRHPLYAFSLAALWFTPLMTANLLTAFVLVTLYFLVGSIHEEQQLVLQFGMAYREYQRHVPRLIPRPGQCYEPRRLSGVAGAAAPDSRSPGAILGSQQAGESDRPGDEDRSQGTP